MESVDVQIRAKASRQPYRRAGLVFSGADWLPVDRGDDDVVIALCRDPVIALQVKRLGEDWSTMSVMARIELAYLLASAGEPLGAALEDDLGSQLDKAKADLVARGEEIAELITDNQDLRDELAEMETAVSVLKAARTELQPDLDAVVGLREQVASLTERLAQAVAASSSDGSQADEPDEPGPPADDDKTSGKAKKAAPAK